MHEAKLVSPLRRARIFVLLAPEGQNSSTGSGCMSCSTAPDSDLMRQSINMDESECAKIDAKTCASHIGRAT